MSPGRHHENREGVPCCGECSTALARSAWTLRRFAALARSHQPLCVCQVLQTPRGALVGEEVCPPKHPNGDIFKRRPQAAGPGASERNTTDLRENVDPQRRQADLEDDARGREVGQREVVQRCTERAQRCVDPLRVGRCRLHPHIQIPRCTRSPEHGEGVCTDNDEADIMVDKRAQQIAKVCGDVDLPATHATSTGECSARRLEPAAHRLARGPSRRRRPPRVARPRGCSDARPAPTPWLIVVSAPSDPLVQSSIFASDIGAAGLLRQAIRSAAQWV